MNTEGNFWMQVASTASKYKGKPAVLLGKGASADDVDKASLEDAFVIGVNDAERIGHVNLSIFHEPWVWSQLDSTEPHADFYLTSVDSPLRKENLYLGTYEPLTQENSELMYQRLFSDSTAVEQVLFMTALRVALKAKESVSLSEIYFVGFDFSVEKGFSQKTEKAASGQSHARQKTVIEMQERIFLHAKELLASKGVSLQHVGYRTFSDLTPGAFSERMVSGGGGSVSEQKDQSKLLLTAEITTNHLGDLSRAKAMMKLARAQGASLVKFQMRDVETFYRKDVLDGDYPSPFGTSFREYRHGLELSNEAFEELNDYASEIGIGWFASVLDEASLDRAIEMEMPMIKIPGTISRKRGFISKVAAKYKGELVFSTGMTSPEYVDWLLEVFGKDRRLYLLHTNSAYPTPPEDCNVSVVAAYAKLAEQYPNVVPGYSSHDEGWLGSALAVACGARMIEKHVKLGSHNWLHFDSVALDLETNEFQEYVAALRTAETVLGHSDKKITASEHHKY